LKARLLTIVVCISSNSLADSCQANLTFSYAWVVIGRKKELGKTNVGYALFADIRFFVNTANDR